MVASKMYQYQFAWLEVRKPDTELANKTGLSNAAFWVNSTRESPVSPAYSICESHSVGF